MTLKQDVEDKERRGGYRMNFKEETLEELKEHGKTWEDVKFIQGKDFSVANSKEEILELMDFEYYDGYGSPDIATDLVIVGDKWWLERHEYDGSEWWEYKELPAIKSESKKVKSFVAKDIGWKSLKEILEEENNNG